MNKFASFLVAAMLVTAAAYAASEVKSGQKFVSGPSGPPVLLFSPADSIGRAWQGGSVQGSASTDDADRDRDNFEYIPDIIDVSMIEGITSYASLGRKDTSDVIPVGQYRHMWLTFRAYPDSGNAATQVISQTFDFAITMRYHVNGVVDDSSSVFHFGVGFTQSDPGGVGPQGYGAVGIGSTTNYAEYETLLKMTYKTRADPMYSSHRNRGYIFPIGIGGAAGIPAWCTHVSFKIRLLNGPGTNSIRMRGRLGLLLAS